MRKINHIRLLQLAFGAVFFLLTMNIVYLAVTGIHFISGNNIREFSTGTGITTRTLYASRGNIYSSDNQLLAGDVVSYKLTAYLSETRKDVGDVPAYVTDPAAYAASLAPIIEMPEDQMLSILQTEGAYLVEFGSYGNDLTPAQKNKIEALELPGIELTPQTKRNYNYGDFASYILGFASSSEDDPEVIEGKMGLEAIMEDYLKGRNGTSQYLTDSRGYALPNGLTNRIEPENGDDVYLTIDTNVQRDLQLQIEKLNECETVETSWAAVMEAKTGKILAIATYPSFDPNVKNIQNYTDLYLDAPYEVGSVMKPFVYLTAYDQGFDLSSTYQSGEFDVGDGFSPIRDWNKVGWGTISYDEGLIRSSNTAIANLLANAITKETLREKYQKLGFFADTSVSGLQSRGGVDNMDGSYRDYLSAGFGQSSSWTALEMLRAYSVFANDGCMVKPYVVDYVLDGTTSTVLQKTETKKSEKIFSTEAINYVKDLMYEVVNNDLNLGTGNQYRMDDVELFGKTGTAELLENGRYSSTKYTYSFAGIAPYDDPEVIVFASMVCNVNDHDAQYTAFPDLIRATVRSALANIELKNTTTSSTESEIESEYVLDNFTNQSVEYASKILDYHQTPAYVIGDGTTVMDQLPEEGSALTAGSKVFLLTEGTNITMPNMVGWSRKEVSSFCNLANITLEYNGTGAVTSQSIPEGEVLTSESVLVIEAS